jgi:hypothetical protein
MSDSTRDPNDPVTLLIEVIRTTTAWATVTLEPGRTTWECRLCHKRADSALKVPHTSDCLVYRAIDAIERRVRAEAVSEVVRDFTPYGLYGKYRIEKNDGTPTDPDAAYFVLRIDTDPAAQAALITYAMRVEDSNPELASDLRHWLAQLGVKLPVRYVQNRASQPQKRTPTLSTVQRRTLKAAHDKWLKYPDSFWLPHELHARGNTCNTLFEMGMLTERRKRSGRSKTTARLFRITDKGLLALGADFGREEAKV